MKPCLRVPVLFVFLTCMTLELAGPCAGAAVPQGLDAGFVTPPAEARPWVYWFWLNGNLTREGITADLEAMQRVGIGGVLIMEVDQGAPTGPVAFGGPEWRELFGHVCREADRLGLEVNMNNDAGWCGSGGPWITPELSMQKVVSAELKVRGPTRLDAPPPRPVEAGAYYADVAILAFPTPTGDAHVADLAGKAGFAPLQVALESRVEWPVLPATATVDPSRIVDLSDRMDDAGRLEWQVPEGDWTVLRVGHTTTGSVNQPAPASGRGLECDKLSREGATAQFAGLMGKLVDDVGPLVGKALVATHIDSWEVGAQNWTRAMPDEFRRRRGYDLRPYLPVLAGRVVGGLEVSERFLWDLRQTIGELALDNYAGQFRELAHRNGLRFTIEAYSGTPMDELAYAGRADEPMSEFWSWWWPESGVDMAFTCIAMASAAHVYGQRIVGAEAFTATDQERWLGHPGRVKALGDWAFCQGINRFVFHRYAMQPWLGVRPGMSMGPWGLHYERTQTWWEWSAPWHEYLARCQHLLRQGLYVADVCYLGPEGAPQTLAFQDRFLATPGDVYVPRERDGHGYDVCPPDALLTRMSVADGRLVLPDGMSYRLLVLPSVETMTPALLRRVRDLVRAGATVAGSRPRKSPSLAGYPACDAEVEQLARELFGRGAPPAEVTARSVGAGTVYWSRALQKSPRVGAAASARLGAAQWIWHAADGRDVAAAAQRAFRRVVTIGDGSPIASAQLVMTADNGFTCKINGRFALGGSNFKRLAERDVTDLLASGPNRIEVVARNGGQGPNPASLIGALTIVYRDGREQTVATDATWESAVADPANGEADASAEWQPAMLLGPPGVAPWGAFELSGGDTGLYAEQGPVDDVLAAMGVAPDFRCEVPRGETPFRFIHRRAGATDLYFVANPAPRAVEAWCTFRVADRQPELWDAETGAIARPAGYACAGGEVRVPLRLGPAGSVFVVFREIAAPPRERVAAVRVDGQRAEADVELCRDEVGRLRVVTERAGVLTVGFGDGAERRVELPPPPPPLRIGGPWTLRFPADEGAPGAVELEHLISWSAHADDGVRHYSGVATYERTFQVPAGVVADDHRVFLDLGRVEVMARVKLNGQDLGIMWRPPFRVDVTRVVREGDNDLRVEVVNLWINRLIGDEQLPEDSARTARGTLETWPEWLQDGEPSPTGRHTFTSWRLWPKDAPLVESGLLGPVELHVARQVRIARNE